MTTIWDVYKVIQFITDTVRNGLCSPEEVGMALDNGQHIFLDSCIRNGDMEAIMDLEVLTPLNTDSYGFLTHPPDFAHRLSIMYNHIPIEELAKDTIGERLKSTLTPVTEDKPVFVQYTNGWQLYPSKEYSLHLNYVKKLPTPVIGYTVSGNAETYDPSSSIQLAFNSNYWPRIILRSLPFIGVNLSDRDVFSLIGIGEQNVANGNQG